ncbi:hypothetical protein FACS1894184_13720 [Clostridia bacterium]|nr:hypothetical protein FACS1894184_13720 [Clostridia bacterium]
MNRHTVPYCAEGVTSLYELPHIVNSILKEARERSILVTPMKLEKLLFILYKQYLQKTGNPLFAERFEAWDYGPVVSDVYTAFASYGARPIKRFMLDSIGKYRYVDAQGDPALVQGLDSVLTRYGGFAGVELSKMTHRVGTAWFAAYMAHEPVLDDKQIKEEPDYLEANKYAACSVTDNR